VRDWRDAVLAGIEPLPRADADGGAGGGHPDDSVWVGHGRLGRADVVVAVWDFSVYGGSFGERDATAFQAACAEAAATRRPLVTLARSGGTRLQEGMRALVGIPRAALGLEQVAAAGVPHVAVADQPTTGGVWVGIVSVADLRVGVTGATVGFSGPRVIEAMTGVAVPRGNNTAESAADAGLLDALVPPEGLATWLENALVTLRPDDPQPTQAPVPVAVPQRSGWEQVLHSREVDRLAGADLLEALVEEAPVALCGADDSVRAAIGRVAGHRVVVAALAGRRAGRATPAGFALLTRAADLAGRLDIALVVLVDTAGADPLPLSEQAGVAPAIARSMTAVLHCAAPTVAVVHGEGGSGGALAGAVTDVVGVTENGWFAALGPEGAGAALRESPQEAADRMGVGPKDLLASGYADALAPVDPVALRAWLGDRLDALRAVPAEDRLARRRDRWSAPLPGSPPSVPGPGPEIA
jgi:acetyl-CoA carboxylase carboxyl transferase subunit beta